MLKSLFGLLLSKFYSKKESELVGHQALPSNESITIFLNKSVDDWTTVQTGVAPFDGYLRLKAKATGNNSASVSILTPSVTTALVYPFATASSDTWLPVFKGQSWSIQGSQSTEITLNLFKTIGGVSNS